MSASLIYLLIGGAALYWLFFMGGKEQLAGMLGDLGGSLGLGGGGSGSGGGGAPIIGSSQSGTGQMRTDERGNNFNIDNDTNTTSNIQGNASVGQIQSQVQQMLQKAGISGSGKSVSINRQIDTTGKAKQTQTRNQKSSVNYAFDEPVPFRISI